MRAWFKYTAYLMIQKKVEPGAFVIAAPDQYNGGNQKNIGPVSKEEDTDERQKHRQIKGDFPVSDLFVIPGGGEIISQNTDI